MSTITWNPLTATQLENTKVNTLVLGSPGSGRAFMIVMGQYMDRDEFYKRWVPKCKQR